MNMKMMKQILSALALCLCLGVAAQTPAETKLYNKTLKKPTVKALDKFLTKFPESVYSLEIMTLRDSSLFASVDKEDAAAVKAFAEAHPDSPLKAQVAEVIRRHNTSLIPRAQARRIAGTDAVGWKMDNVDYVIGVALTPDGNVALATYATDGTKPVADRVIARHTLGAAGAARLADSLAVVDFNSRNLLSFSYINEDVDGGQEFVKVLYDYRNDYAYSAMFYGTSLLAKPSETEYRIEGQCLEALSGGMMTAEQMWLINRINENPSLVPISKADLLTDDAIKWWLGKNPNAATSARKLSFGALDKESSLVEAYGKTSKERGGKFNAALFDLRGYTVIVAYSKEKDDYLLVWCEPVCKDKKRGKLLNSIYFEGGNSLVMFYYHGNRTYKYRVNLADKSLRR